MMDDTPSSRPGWIVTFAVGAGELSIATAQLTNDSTANTIELSADRYRLLAKILVKVVRSITEFNQCASAGGAEFFQCGWSNQGVMESLFLKDVIDDWHDRVEILWSLHHVQENGLEYPLCRGDTQPLRSLSRHLERVQLLL